MVPTDLSLPLTYRQREVERIATAIRAGESCALVGVSSSGKSNLLRFLAEPRVQSYALGQIWAPRLFVLVDGDDLLGCTEDAVYELLLHRLVQTAARRSTAGEEPALDITLIEKVQQLRSASEAQGAVRRVFGQAVGRLQDRGLRIALLLDDFDEAFRNCPPAVFGGLRALRDEHKYRLVYVAATRAPLPSLREYSPRFEAFYELFDQTTLLIGPYNRDDAAFQARRLAAREGRSLLADEVERLVRASGGHAGLLKKAYGAGRGKASLPWPAYLQHLSGERSMQVECQRIWASLNEEERVALALLLSGDAAHPPEAGMRSLLEKGLLARGRDRSLQVFSPLFETFVRAQDEAYRI